MPGKSISATVQYERNLRNIQGTFAIENMTVSEQSRNNLERIAYGQANYHQIIRELQAKYRK